MTQSPAESTQPASEMFRTVWPKGGIYPVLWDFWPKRGERFFEMGMCGINSKRGDFEEFHKK